MINHLVHAAENSEETKAHLKQNEDKFQGDCKIVLQLLYSGKRLTARQLEREHDIDGRRLRDLFEALPTKVKRDWVYTADGKKTKYKEYWIDVPKPTTKSDLQQWWNEFQKEKAETKFYQAELFS